VTVQLNSEVAGHRPKRRGLLGVVLVVLLILILLAAAGAVFFKSGLLSKADSCDTSRMITIAAAPAVEPALSEAVANWNATRPVIDDTCITARTVAQESGQAAAALGPDWDPDGAGHQPQVWVPDSKLWLSVAGSRSEAADLLPGGSPSIASSPVVLALRKPMAAALGWPKKTLTREEVIGALGQPAVWAKAGHPEWAALRVGLTDPATSTAGLASVLSILDPAGTGKVNEQQLLGALQVSRVVGGYAPDVSSFFAAQGPAASVGTSSGIAAFPAVEQQIADYNASNPGAEMVPVYDAQQPVVADFPWVALDATWVTETDRQAVDQLRGYVMNAATQAILARHHLRAPDGGVLNDTLPVASGYAATLPAARAVPDALSLSGVIEAWADLQRKVNLLVVLDTSGSMKAKVPGTKLTRLGLLQQTAGTGFGLLPYTMSIGLWEFSGREGQTSEHRELVPFGPYPANAGAVPRAQALDTAVKSLQGSGDTPLYNTIYAAFVEMQKRWEANSTNSVVLITDGANEVADGLSLQQLTAKLAKEQDPKRPVQIVTIAVGPDADANSLQQVSKASGGRTLVLRDPATAIQTLVLAFTGRVQ
jgi:Ca-activated chloride channel family protein